MKYEPIDFYSPTYPGTEYPMHGFRLWATTTTVNYLSNEVRAWELLGWGPSVDHVARCWVHRSRYRVLYLQTVFKGIMKVASLRLLSINAAVIGRSQLIAKLSRVSAFEVTRKDNGSSGLLLYRVRLRVCCSGLLGEASCTYWNNGRKGNETIHPDSTEELSSARW